MCFASTKDGEIDDWITVVGHAAWRQMSYWQQVELASYLEESVSKQIPCLLELLFPICLIQSNRNLELAVVERKPTLHLALISL